MQSAQDTTPTTPEELRAWRHARGASQKELAQVLGLCRLTLVKWENRQVPMPGYVRFLLASPLLERQVSAVVSRRRRRDRQRRYDREARERRRKERKARERERRNRPFTPWRTHRPGGVALLGERQSGLGGWACGACGGLVVQSDVECPACGRAVVAGRRAEGVGSSLMRGERRGGDHALSSRDGS